MLLAEGVSHLKVGDRVAYGQSRSGIRRSGATCPHIKLCASLIMSRSTRPQR